MVWVSHPNTDDILRVPGYLFWGPTNLDKEANWGTKLGYCETGLRIEIIPKYIYHRIEEDGGEPSIKLYGGTFVRAYATLKNFNAIALSVVFSGLSSDEKINIPGNITAGKNMVTIYDRLLFIPDDRANNPIAILQKACANVVQAFYFKRDIDTMFESVFDGFRKSNDTDGILYIGNIEDGELR